MTKREDIAELELKICYLHNEIDELRSLLTLDELETYTIGEANIPYSYYVSMTNDYPESFV